MIIDGSLRIRGVNNTFHLRVAVLCMCMMSLNFFPFESKLPWFVFKVFFSFVFIAAVKVVKLKSESFSSNYRNVIVGRLDFFSICRIGLRVGENMAGSIELLCPDIVTNQIDSETSRYIHVAFFCAVKPMWNVCTLAWNVHRKKN